MTSYIRDEPHGIGRTLVEAFDPLPVDDMIRECHGRFGEVEHGPALISTKRAALRLKLIGSEVTELAEAMLARDLVKIADALGDIEYAVRGTAFAYGIPLDAVTAEIHRSNMTKDFTDAHKEDAKLVKGPGYEPPDLAPILDAAAAWFESKGNEEAMADIRVEVARPDPGVEFRYTDVDGDQVLVTTADIPGEGPGIYFRTTPSGASIPIARLDDLIAILRAIGTAAASGDEVIGHE